MFCEFGSIDEANDFLEMMNSALEQRRGPLFKDGGHVPLLLILRFAVETVHRCGQAVTRRPCEPPPA